MSFWKAVGKGFAVVGKGSAKAALWASDHPEVVAAVTAIAPPVGASVGAVAQAADRIRDAHDDRKQS